MGRRQHEALETDALLARKDEQISALDARLHQTITHLSLVRARLLSTLDQLDALQQEHTTALATAAREQQRLEVKLRAAEEMARAGEADRMDMRDAVAMLVKRVEATPDFRNWPRSQIQLSSVSEPSQLSLTHQQALISPSAPPSKSHRHKHNLSNNSEVGHLTSSAEQLAYASTLISHFRSERDTALLRAEQNETRVLELEARLARREAALAACSCTASGRGTNGTRLLGAGQTHSKKDERGSSWVRTANDDPFLARRRGRNEQEHDLLDVDADVGMSDILDVSLDRNRELEREVQALSRQLDSVRVPQDSRNHTGSYLNSLHSYLDKEQRAHEQRAQDTSRVQVYLNPTSPRVCTPPPRHQRLSHQRQHSPSPHSHRRHDGDASLLSSLSFSPSSTATSGEAGEATPRQYDYEYHDTHDENHRSPYAHAGHPGGVSDSEAAYDEVFRDTGEDESFTQSVNLGHGKPIHYDVNDVQSGDVREYEGEAITKSVPIPIPSLHALHRQIALLGEKIDAFAAERRRSAEDVSGRSGAEGTRLVEMEEVEVADVYEDDDGDERGARSVIVMTESEGEGWGRDDQMENQMRDDTEDDGESERGGGEWNTGADLRHLEDEGRAQPVQRGSDTNNTTRHNYTEDGERGNDHEPEYMHAALTPPRLSPLPLPMPLSLPTPLPLAQGQPPSSHSHSPRPETETQEPGNPYDHPHETCEATLLAARKREMQLTQRVRVLEGALAVVEARVRQQGAMDEAAAQAPSARNETERWLVDVEVQTLFVVPQPSLDVLAPVGDLDGSGVSNLQLAEEVPRVRVEEGDRESEVEVNADDGEIPMELATPLWPASALLDVHVGADTEDDSDASVGGREPEGTENTHGSHSDSDVGLTPEGEQTSGPDGEGPVPPNKDESPPEWDESPPLADSNQPLEEGNAEAFANSPSLPVLPAPAPSATQGRSSTPPSSTRRLTGQLYTPSPPSSTGTSPTLAVGLLPPLPHHAHLSLPASLLYHSHHTSSLSSPLLPSLNPHMHTGLRRAHTDSDIGAASHAHQAESTHRFVMYRATSSFVAELRQAESRLAQMEVRDEDQSVVEITQDAVDSSMHDVDMWTTAEQEEERPDSNEDLPPLQTLY